MALMESEAHEVKGADWAGRLLRGGRWLATLLVDQLYPPVCAACGAPIETSHGLCPACFKGLLPITAPLCPILGIPFDAVS